MHTINFDSTNLIVVNWNLPNTN